MNEFQTIELAKQIVSLSKRLQEAEAKLQNLETANLTISKLASHAASCDAKSVKADFIELTTKFDKLQTSLATGRGMQQPTTLAKEEYASMKDERIAQASFAEIARFMAEADGINPENNGEWRAYIGGENSGPSFAQMKAARSSK